ncbi:hypothetical protein [Bordetella pseudohinzii]
MDWAADFVLADTIDLLAGLPAIWFVTHSTPLLDCLRAEPGAELGIHPNSTRCCSRPWRPATPQCSSTAGIAAWAW